MDNYIAMGTTPTISVVIKDDEGEPFDFERIKTSSFKFYFKQGGGGGKTIISKMGDAVIVDSENSKVSTYLTQDETLKFSKGVLDIEVRFLFNSVLPNGDNKAGKTVIHEVPIGAVLKKEVITDGSE